ncbi:MAG TPA: hypothetical protein VM580_25230 [Labilithrix sp.]|jgi:hypothetical protein|nr:hypothetical protein [Labilithrix sp.]
MIEDHVGSATCIASANVANRQPCEFANDCADGHMCIDGPNGGECRMFCLKANSKPPFDVSMLDNTPGRGGCPAGETCTGPRFQNLPDWLQLCELPGGG